MNKPYAMIITHDKIDLDMDGSICMSDVLKAYNELQTKHSATANEIELKVWNSWIDRDRIYCRLVFRREVYNPNFQKEMKEYEAFLCRESEEYARAAQAKKQQQEAKDARQAWKLFARAERVARKTLGRYPSVR